jgi:hypothetical protein
MNMIKALKDNLIVVAVLLAILAMAIVFVHLPTHGVVVYNCNIAEISPDIPIKVKEECRKLNSERII